ncbi:MAG: hypothetical protein NXI31_26765 [bacterium]|nr:hypothetical protein [bacterium]
MTDPRREPDIPGHEPSNYDRAVQRCLDDRVDPLDDPEAIAALLAEPEALADFARLHERLGGLREIPITPAIANRRPWALPLAALLAVGGLAIGGAFAFGESQAASRPEPSPGAGRLLAVRVAERDPTHVSTLAWSVRERHEHSTPHHRIRVVITETGSRKP